LKSYILHKDWSLTVSKFIKNGNLSHEEAGSLLEAIFDYQLVGEINENLSNTVLLVFLPLVDQFRRDEERYSERVERNKQNGVKGGRPSKEEKKEKIPSEEVSKVPKVKPVSLFDDFYNIYPKKVGKQQAIKAYNKAIKSTPHETIMEGLKQYKAHILSKGTEMQFIKHPSTWLNGTCWDDEYESINSISPEACQVPVESFSETFKKTVGDNGYFIHNGEQIKLPQITQILDHANTRYMVGTIINHVEEFITVDLRDLKYA